MPVPVGILLAAGSGSRIWPYSEVRSKCALSAGNVPIVRRLAGQMAALGIRQIVVAVGAHAGSVRHALLGWSGASVSFVESPTGSGSGAALLDAWRSVDAETALVACGDAMVADDDLRRVSEALTEGVFGAALTDDVPDGSGQGWIGVVPGAHGRITAVGHAADSARRLSGVYALRRAILPILDANPGLLRSVPVGGMPALEQELAQSLNDCPEGVLGIPAQAPVVDVDKPWHILAANRLAVDTTAGALPETYVGTGAAVHDGAEVSGHVHLGEGSSIGNRVVVKGNLIVGAHTRIENGAIFQGNAIVGDRCRISDYCLIGEGTSIGNDCVVGHGAEIDGVMFDGSYLWHYCEISGVVGQSVDIGAATVCGTLRFDDLDATHLVKSRRERPRLGANATYFGDFSRTGVNVITQPGAKIGAYSCVGPGIVVIGDVPSRTLRLLKQETSDTTWGPERYGW